MPFDTVSYNGKVCSLVKARYSPLRIAGTLVLNSKMRYGQTSRGVPLYLFHPENPAYPMAIVGSSSKDTSQNQRVLIEYTEWKGALPQGIIIQHYGPAGTYAAEEAVAHAVSQPPLPKQKTGHGGDIPLLLPQHIPTLTTSTWVCNIDPPGCEDIDDAFGLEPTAEEGVYNIHILIAAAAAYIQPGTPADATAALRSATLYTPGGTPLQHMLPTDFATAAASLKADGKLRPTLAWSFSYDTKTRTIGMYHGFHLVLTKNHNSYSYDRVESEAPTWAVAVLRSLTRTLKGNEDDPHSWVEVAMIAYNEALAGELRSRGIGVLRTHNAADAAHLEAYSRLGGPALAKYALQSARYISPQAERTNHDGLGRDLYTHGTSPLRRYADLYNQQCMLAALYPDTYSVPAEPFDSAFHNKRGSALKTYARALHFLECIEGESKTLEVTIIEVCKEKEKLKIWVPAWELVLTWRHPPEELLKENTIGVCAKVRYYLNKNAPSMKERFVMECVA
jgi:exoribonuclease R